jgi:hypothetical protein
MGAPEIWSYIKDDERRKAAEIVVSQQAFERPYFARREFLQSVSPLYAPHLLKPRATRSF